MAVTLVLLLLKDFNSIKVRLELLASDILTYLNKFQFHKGTIRTLSQVHFLALSNIFQFHKGTIRTFETYLLNKTRRQYFNSIKVRLELNTVLNPIGKLIFQFHKGTIRTHCLGIYNILIFNRIRGCKVNKSY